MPDTVTSQIYDGEHNVVVHLNSVSDGTGQSGVIILDPSTLIPTTNLLLWRCEYDITGGGVNIQWDGTPDSSLIVMSGTNERDFSFWGGLINDAATPTGLIRISTIGFVLNSGYSITLEFKKGKVLDQITVPVPPITIIYRLITFYSPGAYADNFDGELGLAFTIDNPAALSFNRIGVRSGPSSTGLHTVTLRLFPGVGQPVGAVLRTASIDLTGIAEGDYGYAEIAEITPTLGVTYLLTTTVTFGSGQPWPNNGPVTVITSSLGLTGACYVEGGIVNFAGSDQMYYGVDLAFAA